MEFSVRIWKWSFSFLIFRRILLGNVERRLGEKKRALLSKEIEISLKGGPEAFGPRLEEWDSRLGSFDNKALCNKELWLIICLFSKVLAAGG